MALFVFGMIFGRSTRAAAALMVQQLANRNGAGLIDFSSSPTSSVRTRTYLNVLPS